MKSIPRIVAAAALIAACAAAVILITSTKNSSPLIDGERLQAISDAAEYPSEAAETAVLSVFSMSSSGLSFSCRWKVPALTIGVK